MSVYMHLSFLIILEDGFFFLYLAGTCNTLFFIISNMSTGKQEKTSSEWSCVCLIVFLDIL